MAIEVNGNTYETDEEGYLVNLHRLERGHRQRHGQDRQRRR